MTKDFAKPSTTRKNSPGKNSKARKTKTPAAAKPAPSKGRGKLILLLLILVTGFAYALYLLNSVPPTSEPIATKPGKIEPKTATSKETQQTEAKEQRFKFYDLLPESTVEAPKVDAYKFKERGAEDATSYMIQTGSFRNLADAERQKAMIAFQGLKASIRTIQNSQGTTWHRVTTGPFNTRTDMNSALDKLVAINIEPLVKKVKP